MFSKREILSVALLVGMMSLTTMSYISESITTATNCLIITIVTTFIYLLITFLQNKTHLYNIPYNIPDNKRPQANAIIAQFIFTTKCLTTVIMALLVVALYLKSDIITYIALTFFGISFIYAICICNKKIRNLLNQR